MAQDESRIPVLVGVGQINDRPANDEDGLDSAGLMKAALEKADEDAGGGWIARADSLAVVNQISFPMLGDLSVTLAAAFGITPRYLEQTALPMGDSPILLIHEAANRIGAGDVTVACVVGGEALRTAARRAAAAVKGKAAPNAAADMAARQSPSLRVKYGLTAPVNVYPLYENGCRAAWGQTLAEAQDESGRIWSRFSEVAAGNEGAWLRAPMSAEQIATPGASNRPIAFPYSKLMVANSSVNQGAAAIVTSLAAARAAGIPESRLVYIGQGAAAHEADDPLERDSYAHSVSMEISLAKTLELNGLAVDDFDYVELYSCFPCVPKMARRVIGLPVDRPATVFGGLTFGGGPIANYMMHAVVSMVQRLRERGTNGLLFANGGYATHNHSMVITRRPVPAGTFPQNFDFQRDADAQRGTVPALLEDYAGTATLETYTVMYNRDGEPQYGAIVGRTPDGERFLARLPKDDRDGIDFLISGASEPVGTRGTVTNGDGINIWRRA